MLLLVTPPEVLIIWFGKGFVVTEDADTFCICLHLVAMFWSHYGGHHGSHPLLFDYCLLHWFIWTTSQIDRPRLSKKTARQICSLPEWIMTAPVFISWWMSQIHCACIEIWCDAFRWPMLPIVLKDYLASSEKVNKVHCISLKGPFERIVLRPREVSQLLKPVGISILSDAWAELTCCERGMDNDVFLLKQMFWCQQEWKMPTMYISCVCLFRPCAKRGCPWLWRHVHPWFDGLDLRCGWKMLYERPPKPPTIRNSYTRTLVLDTIMKLSGTIGVTQKTMTFDTHVCQIFEFEDIHPTS